MDKTKIQATFEVSIEIVFRDQIFQRDPIEWPEISGFVTEHAPPRWSGV